MSTTNIILYNNYVVLRKKGGLTKSEYSATRLPGDDSLTHKLYSRVCMHHSMHVLIQSGVLLILMLITTLMQNGVS